MRGRTQEPNGFPSRGDGRPHLGGLLRPRRVAIVGASRDPRTLSGRYLDHLRRHGFPGEIVPINRRADEVQGIRAYPSLEAIPDRIDCAIISVPGAAAREAAETAARLRVPLTVLFASGFAESGKEGRRRQEDLADAFRATGSRLLGPNCPGFVNAGARIAAAVSAFAGGHDIPPGPVSIASQSGAVGGLIAERVLDLGCGLGGVIFTGNEADVEIGEAIEALTADPGCRAIACFAEGLRDPEAALAAVRRATAAGIAVLMMSAGRSEESQRAAALHTGKLVAVGEAERAALAQAGAVLIDDLIELAEASAAFIAEPRRGSGRVGVISTTGGLGAIAADHVRAAGCSLPPLPGYVEAGLAEILPAYASTQNPCDFADALLTHDRLLQHAAEVFSGAGVYDALLVTMAVHPPWLADRLADDLVEAGAATTLPIMVLWPGGSMGADAVRKVREGGVPVLESGRACGAVLHALTERVLLEPSSIAPGEPAEGPLENDLKQALAADGLRRPDAVLAGSVAEVERAWGRIGGAVVMKAHSPPVDHKARLGLVRRGITDARAAADTWRDFQRAAVAAGIELDEVLVEEEVSALGLEILVSCRRTSLGLELLVAPGGLVAEMACRRALRIGPLAAVGVGEMAREIGLPTERLDSLITVVESAQRLALAYGDELDILELNPVLLSDDGPFVLDAKLRTTVS